MAPNNSNEKTITSTRARRPCNALPLELWRVVFSYFSVIDLCRCAQVCKDWAVLIESLDATRWKELYFQAELGKRWKPPHWPIAPKMKPISWQAAYKTMYSDSRLWLNNYKTNTSCSSSYGLFNVFKRKRERRTLRVGLGKKYLTIKSVLAAASPFDKIVLSSGVYQEQFPFVLKFPLEIVGSSDATKVTLMMPIEMQAATARISNITIRPYYPRPRGASSVLVKVITGHLHMDHCNLEYGHLLVTSPGSLNIRYCSFNLSYVSFKAVPFSVVQNNYFKPDRVGILVEELSLPVRDRYSDTHGRPALLFNANNDLAIQEFYASKLSICTMHYKTSSNERLESRTSPSKLSNAWAVHSNMLLATPVSDSCYPNTESGLSNHTIDAQTKRTLRLMHGVVIRNNKITAGRGGITVCRMSQCWIEGNEITDLVYGIRCVQSSRIIAFNNIVNNCETSGFFFRDHSGGLLSFNNILCCGEAGIDIRNSANPVIQHNAIHSGRRSGIVCLDNSRGLIRFNDIFNNREAGVYVLYKANPVVKYNYIMCGQVTGIAITEDGKGHISHNEIVGSEWAGIDIRHGANPVVSHNVIRNGQADGIVVGKRGKGMIYDNTIEDNGACGLWILDGAHPVIHSNRIIRSGDAGIAFMSDIDSDYHGNQEILAHEFHQQDHHQDSVGESSDDDEIVSPLAQETDPESRYMQVSRSDKNLPQIEANTICENQGHGIVYSGSEGVVIAKNMIEFNGRHGVHLQCPSADTVIQNNRISGNQCCGILSEIGVTTTITGNGIYHNYDIGICLSGMGMVKTNDIISIDTPCLQINPSCDPHIVRNRMFSRGFVCVRIERDARGFIESNQFYYDSKLSEYISHHNLSNSHLADNEEFPVQVITTAEEKVKEVAGLEYKEKGDVDFRHFISPLPRPHLNEIDERTAPFYTANDKPVRNTIYNSNVLSRICLIM